MLTTPWVKRHVGSLGAAINDVVAGRRSGYTFTGNWRFDVNDPVTMKRVYDQLGPRQMFVIASTNRTLEEYTVELMMRNLKRPGAEIRAAIGDDGIGIWRADDGTIYVDEVHVWVGLSRSEAIVIGRNKHQKYILRVDGRTRSFEFIPIVPVQT